MIESRSPDRKPIIGNGRIAGAFRRAQETRAAALMPYFTLGYPDLEQSLEIIKAIASQADLIELGVPFSDPIADGPTIQRSTQTALEQGITTGQCIRSVGQLRDSGVDAPILLMGYYNPILAYGEDKYVRDAAAAGADGFIVPDLPIEEAGDLVAVAKEHDLAVISFLAPTSNINRIELVARQATGFIYLVSVAGVTGARSELNVALAPLVREIKARSEVPVAVGFGISGPEQAAAVAAYADGIIVGSALINAVDRSSDRPAAAAEFVRSLADALELE